MKKKHKGKIVDIFLILTLILGVVLVLSPFIVNKYYDIRYNMLIENFDNEASDVSLDKRKSIINASREYNRELKNKDLEDPFSEKQIKSIDEKQKKGIETYLNMLSLNNNILGYVEIPKIKVRLPIYVGSGTKVLEKGAGHMIGTSLPVGGVGTNCVIAAHRGMGRNKMFKDLGEVKKSDIFYVNNMYEKLKYRVVGIYIVKPNDISKIEIVPEKDYCTLLTCTPYLSNTDRLIVRGEHIAGEDKKLDAAGKNKKTRNFVMIVVLVAVLIVVTTVKKRKKKK